MLIPQRFCHCRDLFKVLEPIIIPATSKILAGRPENSFERNVRAILIFGHEFFADLKV